jgi:hypothetical protein
VGIYYNIILPVTLVCNTVHGFRSDYEVFLIAVELWIVEGVSVKGDNKLFRAFFGFCEYN